MPAPLSQRTLSIRAGVELQEIIGLSAWEGRPLVMAAAHRHNELELNLLAQGTAVYFFGGRRVKLPAGSLMLFWAIAPHQLVESTPDSYMYWLTLPLAWFLHRNWPAPFRRAVLNSELTIDPAPNLVDLFRQWQIDLARDLAEDRELVLLEAETHLKRMAARLDLERARPVGQFGASLHHQSQAEKMAAFLSNHYLENLPVHKVADFAGLHPNYAMEIFHKAFGLTIVEYLTNLRVAHAQQLLVNTDQSVLSIALDSGFGSLSQFYAAFNRLCGLSPRKYRESLL